VETSDAVIRGEHNSSFATRNDRNHEIPGKASKTIAKRQKKKPLGIK
jgi:hypothetical protein